MERLYTHETGPQDTFAISAIDCVNRNTPGQETVYPLDDVFDRDDEHYEGEYGVNLIRDSAERIAHGLADLFDSERGEFSYTTKPADVRKLAAIQNELTRYFVYARNTDVSLLEKEVTCKLNETMRQCTKNSECGRFVNHFFHGLGEDMHDGPVQGAISEAKYIKARATKLNLWDAHTKHRIENAESSNRFSKLCTNVDIDAFNKVDVVEVHYTKDKQGVPERVTMLCLVQIKTKEFAKDRAASEIKTIHAIHQKHVAQWKEYPMEAFNADVRRGLDSAEQVFYEEAIHDVIECMSSTDTLEDVLGAIESDGSKFEGPERAYAFYSLLQGALSVRRKDCPDLFEKVQAKVITLEHEVRVARASSVPVRVESVLSVVKHGEKVDAIRLAVPHHDNSASGLEYRQRPAHKA